MEKALGPLGVEYPAKQPQLSICPEGIQPEAWKTAIPIQRFDESTQELTTVICPVVAIPGETDFNKFYILQDPTTNEYLFAKSPKNLGSNTESNPSNALARRILENEYRALKAAQDANIEGVLRAVGLVLHPNFREKGEEGFGALYLVMPQVYSGEYTETLYDKTGSSELRLDMYNVLLDVLKTLGQLHAIGIVHGDLKLDQILLGKRPLLADFGLVNVWDSQRRSPRSYYGMLRRIGARISPAGYQDPRLADDDINAVYEPTIQSDLYSFGMMLVEMFAHLSPPEYVASIEQVKSTLAKRDIPGPLKKIIIRSLTFQYPSAEEMGNDLATILESPEMKPWLQETIDFNKPPTPRYGQMAKWLDRLINNPHQSS